MVYHALGPKMQRETSRTIETLTFTDFETIVADYNHSSCVFTGLRIIHILLDKINYLKNYYYYNAIKIFSYIRQLTFICCNVKNKLTDMSMKTTDWVTAGTVSYTHLDVYKRQY